jgi:hypothetical protein
MAQPRSLWPASADEPLALDMRSRDVVCVWPAREERNGGVRWCGVVVATAVLPLKNKRFILGHNNPPLKKTFVSFTKKTNPDDDLFVFSLNLLSFLISPPFLNTVCEVYDFELIVKNKNYFLLA